MISALLLIYDPGDIDQPKLCSAYLRAVCWYILITIKYENKKSTITYTGYETEL